MKINKIIKIYCTISLLVLCIFISGCSFLSPIKDDQTKYLISQSSTWITKRAPRHISLLVMQPETAAVYNTFNMAYTIKPYQIAFFSQNRWAEKPAQMLHPLIVEALQNTHYFHTVITPPFIGQYDYLLNTQILTLIQDFISPRPVLKLVVRAQLGRVATNRIIATKQFIIDEPMLQRTPYAGVLAANRAVSTLLTELALFCIENTDYYAYRHVIIQRGQG